MEFKVSGELVQSVIFFVKLILALSNRETARARYVTARPSLNELKWRCVTVTAKSERERIAMTSCGCCLSVVGCFLVPSLLLPLLTLQVDSGCVGGKGVVFNFGDSNSDTGAYSAGLGVQLSMQEGRTFFHRPSGRLCDGRLMIDFFRECD